MIWLATELDPDIMAITMSASLKKSLDTDNLLYFHQSRGYNLEEPDVILLQ